jgi:cobalt-zinc-cadmium efflux system membrane fusion protein
VPTLARVSSIVLLFSLGCAVPFGSSDHGHGHEEAEDPRPDLSFTVYADGLELFLETPAFVVGQESALVAHFTDARSPDGFAWVTAGRVTATLRFADGGEEVFTVDHLLRNGIFKPVVKPTHAGSAELTLRLEGEVAGTVPVGTVTVFPSVEAAVAGVAEEEPAEPVVGYLKESQWKTVYATAPAESTTLRGSVRATGELVAPIGARAALDSPTSGGWTAPSSCGSAPKGSGRRRARAHRAPRIRRSGRGRCRRRRRRGGPRARRRGAAARRVAVPLGGLRQGRWRRRGRPRSSPGSGWLRAGAAAGVVGWRVGGAELRSPIAGRVAFVHADPGSVVAMGAPVVEVVDAERLWLEARVFEIDAPGCGARPGRCSPWPDATNPSWSDAAHGGTSSPSGPAVDPVDRTVPVVFELPNPGDLLPGSYADVRVFTAEWSTRSRACRSRGRRRRLPGRVRDGRRRVVLQAAGDGRGPGRRPRRHHLGASPPASAS